MKLTKEHIVLIIVFLVIVGAVGAVYKLFYLKRMDEFTKNLSTLTRMETTLVELEETFDKTVPQALIDAYTAQLDPLVDEVDRRARFFNTGDMLKIEPIPEDQMLRFYYKDELAKLIQDLRQHAYSRTPFCDYPRGTFGAPYPDDLAGTTVTKQVVRKGLRRATFGCSMTRMLMKAKAKRIDNVEVWPVRVGSEGLLVYRTVGLGFLMDLKDLVKFIDDVRLADQYYNVEALSIQNPYLRFPTQPPVEVRMLLTQADYVKPSERKATGPRPGAGTRPRPGPGGAFNPFGRGPMSDDEISSGLTGLGRGGRDRRNEVPLTRWGRFKRWFFKYFWPFG